MDALPEHTIHFSGLKDGQHRFEYKLGDAFFQASGMEELELGGMVNARVTVDKTEHLLVANIHVEGHVRVRCDHCNAPMDQPIRGDQRQIFQTMGIAEVDDEELVPLAADAHEVNLTHYLFECITLNLPARHVHPEGACDPEVEKAFARIKVDQHADPDPRWDALKSIKDKN